MRAFYYVETLDPDTVSDSVRAKRWSRLKNLSAREIAGPGPTQSPRRVGGFLLNLFARVPGSNAMQQGTNYGVLFVRVFILLNIF